MRRVLVFFESSVAVRLRPARRICFPGVRNLLVAGERECIARKRGKHGQGGKTSQRPEALVHSVIPREPTGMSHEIARSVRLERHEGYHHRPVATVTYRQQRTENCGAMEPKIGVNKL